MSSNSEGKYGVVTGMVFIFNLIVGTGALTLPKVFAEAGWLAGGVTIVFLAFLSFITVTYVVEAMSTTNALAAKLREQQQQVQATDSDSENEPLLESNAAASPFEIVHRFELGHMARMYFSGSGVTAFYVVMCVYLYGDLAIYAVAVPKSLRDVACTFRTHSNGTAPSTLMANRSTQWDDPCWLSSSIRRIDAYRIFVALFAALVCPFGFFNVQKTKYLQLATTASRWFAFSVMLTLASAALLSGRGTGHPPALAFGKIPQLFGASVYSFMCHHSLPALVTPIDNKRRWLLRLLLGDFSLILVFYLSLSYTGIFAFNDLEELYTLNFQPNGSVQTWPALQYFLALFPVFALSTSFPIISITLRGNLRSLFAGSRGQRRFHWLIERIGFPLLAIGPPLCVAMATDSVKALVSYTGSYAGALLQYAIPVMLLHCSRRKAASQLPPSSEDQRYTQLHASPFGHAAWLIGLLLWTLVCIVLVTLDNFVVKDVN